MGQRVVKDTEIFQLAAIKMQISKLMECHKIENYQYFIQLNMDGH
jgi:hypothetical protein